MCSSIGGNAFENCNSLTQVSLPMCEYIGEGVFQYCSLSQVNLPMCEYIAQKAFEHCNILSDVSLPVCSHIGMDAFWNCYSLSQLSLPMCSYIDGWAFENCSSLSIITIGYSSICSLGDSNAFTNTPIASGTGSIYVPTSLVDSYKSAANWSNYSSQIFPISE